MSVKRSRSARSTSSGDTGVVVSQLSSPAAGSPELLWHTRSASSGAPSAPPPPPAPADDQRRPPPRPGILTLSSPVAAEDWSQERIGNFLESCFCCEKRIGESDEVFMYGHLRAFCTTDCREKQVAMDKLREKRSVGSKKVGGGHTAK